jgi:tRNA-specific 2-thiouridylase
MQRESAELVFTGEVLGQRPMTQTRTIMNMLEKQSGLKGRLLRPLCAKMFLPTIPETEGLVERDKLLDIHGRGRRRQMELAEKYGLDDYPTPAGGCVLTQKEYAAKALDMMRHTDKPLDAESLELLKTGRHFRISPEAKLVVGRDEQDNIILEGFKERRISLQSAVTLGPLALLEGNPSDAEIETAARITARYTKEKRSDSVKIAIARDGKTSVQEIKPFTDPEMEGFRIHLDKKRLFQFWKERALEKGYKVAE